MDTKDKKQTPLNKFYKKKFNKYSMIDTDAYGAANVM